MTEQTTDEQAVTTMTTTNMNANANGSGSSPDQLNRSIYLLPEELTPNEANDKARPAERPEARAARVAEMAESIKINGQEYPVLVVEIDDGDSVTYEYVDGGCRVEAIAKLNSEASEGAAVRKVWCNVQADDADLFRLAVTANLHRTQNSVMDMAQIIQEARERNGWKGRGAQGKVAEYLGLRQNRVSEYEKILHAPETIRRKIETGEIPSLDAALKLMALPAADREKVAKEALLLARGEAGLSADSDLKTPIKAKHITAAAKKEEALRPRSRGEIIEFFTTNISEAAGYPKPAVAFVDGLVDWARGKGSDNKLVRLMDAAVHMHAPVDKLVEKKEVKKEDKSNVKPAKPAASGAAAKHTPTHPKAAAKTTANKTTKAAPKSKAPSKAPVKAKALNAKAAAK